MSVEVQLLINVAAAVTIALAGGLLAHRLGQSVIVGYLLAGVIIGPFTPGFTADRSGIAALAEVGVIFLMFALGIEFSVRELARVRNIAIFGTLAQVTLTIAAGLGLGLVFGWPLAQALFFGGIISISSTMVILKTLADRGEVASMHGRVLLGMLVIQDLVVVILIVLLPGLASGTPAALGDLALTVAKAALFAGATVFLGIRVVPRLMAAVERLGSSELFLLTAVALALGTAGLSAILGLSTALGAFLAGLLLAETEYDHRIIAEVIPMRDVFATLFFVSIGMLIDPAFILANFGTIIGLAAAIAAIKIGITLLVLLPTRLSGRTITLVSLGMLQIGEFSYVMARVGSDVGAISNTVATLILTTSLVTIVATPTAFAIGPAVAHRLGRLPWIGRRFRPGTVPSFTEGDLSGHAIVAGYGRVGQQVVAGLSEAGMRVVVIDEDLHRAQAVAAANMSVVLGDAGRPAVLAAARVQQAALVVVALPDSIAINLAVSAARRANVGVPIVARVARADDADAIRQAGATATVAPERAGALLLLDECARFLEAPIDHRRPERAIAESD
ncbi:MAG: cation:proton antiporter [Chloroflexi bacterium]|nr:cation:proton antiporter [Chloroflexota bacterium]